MPKKTKWQPWDGAFRAAGEGEHGLHHGSPVWTLDAATHRREALAPYVSRSWVETFKDGTWKRLGDVIRTEEPPPAT